MTSAQSLPPRAIECGLRGLRSIAACVVEDGPRFDEREKRWVITMVLRRDEGVQFIGTATRWCVLLDGDYPFGRVSFHPAAEGGLTVTFPHQAANTPDRDRQGWRAGRLCTETPFGGERRVTAVRDPIGDAERRLKWHAERALNWLHRAANDQLVVAGDPFELPDRPHTTVRDWIRPRVVHDETASSFPAWKGRERSFGVARFGGLSGVGNVVAVDRFEDQHGAVVRAWSGRELDSLGEPRVSGFWWLWPKPIILPPWQAPFTWGDLRHVAKAMDIDADAILQWLFPRIRGAKASTILMMGYPVPLRVGADPGEIHWDALILPRLAAASGRPPNGFRPNARGWWRRDRGEKLADKVALQYLYTENWNGERLHSRGRLPSAVRDLRLAVVGVGALGSSLAEMFARAGVREMALVDSDSLAAGNICRHVATLADAGESKVQVVAQRLRQISPSVRVIEVRQNLCGDAKIVVEQLEEYDVIIDCTASDAALEALARAWWSVPRIFASFSLGHAAKRLFSFGLSGHEFPQREFAASVGPWLEHEGKFLANSEEVLEGAGCWSPLFPARYDDVLLAAATCVKEVETLVASKPLTPRFRVFRQLSSDDGFQGFVPENAPPAEALPS